MGKSLGVQRHPDIKSCLKIRNVGLGSVVFLQVSCFSEADFDVVDVHRKDMGYSTLFKENTPSIFLVAPLSKCQHPGWTNSMQEGPNADLQCNVGQGTVQYCSLVNQSIRVT